MGNPLRDRRTPQELAASGQIIEFSQKIGDLEQLAGIVEGDLETLDPDKMPSGWRDSVVNGRLSFGFADAQDGVPKLEGTIEARVDVVCQRCLDTLELPLTVELKLLFGGGGTASASDDGFEVWELEEEALRPIDLVEEALIMAMPLAAMHEGSDTCQGQGVEETEPGEKIRPFAALKAQMENEN